jgi:hypothetical protein
MSAKLVTLFNFYRVTTYIFLPLLLLEATAELLVIFRSALAPTAAKKNISQFMLRLAVTHVDNIQRKYKTLEFIHIPLILHITAPKIQHTSWSNFFHIKIRLLPP